MDILECIKTRRSNRKFLSRSIEQEKLDKIIEAGRFAPSGGNSQSTHFVVIKNSEVIAELAQIVQGEFAKMEISDGMYHSLVSSITQSKRGNYVFHYNPSVFIILTNKKGYGNAMADSVCAIQNMMLMANELGLGSCYINQLHWLDENISVREYLKKFDVSDDETICCSLSIGYVENLIQKTTERTGNKVTFID